MGLVLILFRFYLVFYNNLLLNFSYVVDKYIFLVVNLENGFLFGFIRFYRLLYMC